jgi:hypothetical protein
MAQENKGRSTSQSHKIHNKIIKDENNERARTLTATGADECDYTATKGHKSKSNWGARGKMRN